MVLHRLNRQKLDVIRDGGYGLGKSGWVSAKLGPDHDVPVELLKEWITESYRAIAPKKLIALLDSEPAKPTKRSRPKNSK